MQRSGWERQSAALRATGEQIKNNANLYLIRVTDEKIKVKNAAIVGILSQDEVPHAGARVGFTILVQNSGSEAITNLSLTLQVDGQMIEKDPRAIPHIGPRMVPVPITGVIDKRASLPRRLRRTKRRRTRSRTHRRRSGGGQYLPGDHLHTTRPHPDDRQHPDT
jgi:hypothetical protein